MQPQSLTKAHSHLASPVPQQKSVSVAKPHSAIQQAHDNFFLSNCNVTIINNNYFSPRQQLPQKPPKKQANWHTLKEMMFK